jgi:hypothetical protein
MSPLVSSEAAQEEVRLGLRRCSYTLLITPYPLCPDARSTGRDLALSTATTCADMCTRPLCHPSPRPLDPLSLVRGWVSSDSWAPFALVELTYLLTYPITTFDTTDDDLDKARDTPETGALLEALASFATFLGVS